MQLHNFKINSNKKLAMSKIGIIIKREYLSRVTKRTFILTTIGLPLVMIGFSALMGYLSATTVTKLNIAVVDESGIFQNNLWDSSSTKSVAYFNKGEYSTLQKTYLDKKFDMLVHINAFKNNLPDTNAIQVFSESSISGVASNYLTDRLNTVYQNKLMLDAGMNRKQIDSLNSVTISFTPITIDKNTGNADMNSAIGYFSGFLIYIVMFIYGMMVMRGVMEEKTNRIAEVIISSVKPFELMMGKVLGIALVGLTQFVLWIAFIGIIFMVSSTFFPGLMPHDTMPIGGVPGMEAMPQEMMKKVEVTNKIQEFMGMPWLLIGFSFLFYFIGGYLLYASLFAAVGSLVNEDAQDAQGLTFPITMPIIAGFLIAVQAAQDPNSSLAVFGSIFPLTSPIVMMSRIAYHPPAWQIALSMALLIATFIGTIWLSAKIYRTGILMYGKKVTWKEALKWVWK